MRKDSRKASRVYKIIAGLAMQALFFLPWLKLDVGTYSTIGYLIRIFTSGNFKATVVSDFTHIAFNEGAAWGEIGIYVYTFVAQVVLLAITQLVSLIGILIEIKGKDAHKLFLAVFWISVAPMAMFFESPVFDVNSALTNFYIFFIVFGAAVVILGDRIVSEWIETNEIYHEKLERERAEDKDRKDRLRFEGRYSSIFAKVILKNFKYNFKSYGILVSISTLAVSFIYASLSLREVMSGANASENIILGQGLGTIIMSFIFVVCAVALFLIISILLFYLKTRIKNYGIFTTLGMRKRTVYLFIAAEIVACIVVSIVLGLIFGTFLRTLCVFGIIKLCGDLITPVKPAIGSVLITIFITLVIYLFATLLTKEMYIDTGASGSSKRLIERENMPGKYSKYMLIPGVAIILFALIMFTKLTNFEYARTLIFFFVGVFAIMFFGLAIYFKKLRHNDSKYLGSLLEKNQYYYRFSTTIRYIFLFTVVNFAILFVFGKGLISATIAEPAAKQFNYDYVCMATEDDYEIFDDIEDKYDVDVMRYPMVRATNCDNTENADNIEYPIFPQGQMIGISESTYKALCKNIGRTPAKLELSDDGTDVHAVFQQDRSVVSHPLDYYAKSKHPWIHVGQPLENYAFNFRMDIYQKSNLVSYETGALLGNFRQGKHENIIVFSDKYFDSVQNKWKTDSILDGMPLEEEAIEDVNMHHWPDRLVLININDGADRAKAAKGIESELKKFNDNHAFDNKIDGSVLSYYDRSQLVKERTGENIMNIVSNGLIVFILMLVSTVLMYIKSESELSERIRKHEYLRCLGMSRKERIKLLKKERSVFVIIPMVLGTVFSIIFTLMIWNLRQYSQAVCIEYMKCFALLFVVNLIIQVVGTRFFEFMSIIKIEGKNNGND